jgi:transcription initiation factor TFIIIB Brf1 subunit/transcription initiation factor TFIIB
MIEMKPDILTCPNGDHHLPVIEYGEVVCRICGTVLDQQYVANLPRCYTQDDRVKKATHKATILPGPRTIISRTLKFGKLKFECYRISKKLNKIQPSECKNATFSASFMSDKFNVCIWRININPLC